MLETEFHYYIENQQDLVKKYNGKHLIIVGKNVIGAYDTPTEAYNEALKKYSVGEFLIQECTPGKESYTQTYHSRVIFT